MPPRNSWSFAGPFGKFDRGAAAARLQGLPGSLLDLPRPQAAVVPQPRRAGGPASRRRRPRRSRPSTRSRTARTMQGEMFERDGPARPTASRRRSPGRTRRRRARSTAARCRPTCRCWPRRAPTSAAFPGSCSTCFSQYQEQGVDYIVALLKGYKDKPPEGFDDPGRRQLQRIFPRPFDRDAAAADRRAGRLHRRHAERRSTNMAKDVAAFLMWAAEPHLDARKRIGFQVMIFLIDLRRPDVLHQEEGLGRRARSTGRSGSMRTRSHDCA